MKARTPQLLFLVLILSVASFGQLSSGGQVVEVLDGRTMVVASPNGRITVELQYIEVPDARNPLRQAVTDHLRKLLVGKIVEFKAREIRDDRVVGRVRLNNVDVSEQMLRDGAATHIPRERTGQDRTEFEGYASMEAAAKTEKRGVWAPVITTSAWTRKETTESNPTRTVVASIRKPPVAKREMQTPDAAVKADPSAEHRPVASSFAILEFTSEDKTLRVECLAMYQAANSPKVSDDSVYVLGFRTESPEFGRSGNRVTVVAERYVFPLTPFSISAGKDGGGFKYYKISKAMLLRIANTRTVELQIDGFKAALTEEAKEYFRQLLSTSE